MKDRGIKKFAAVLLTAALAAAIISGCGDKNGSSASGATPDSAPALSSGSASTEPVTRGDITNPDTTGQQSGKTNSADSELAGYVQGSIDEFSYEGVAYLTENGAVTYSTGGDINDLYRIASVSKQFTAAAVLTLYEEGKLDINSSIEQYFPEYSHAGEITIHQLMCMRSGIPDYMVMADGIVSPEETYGISADNSAQANSAIIKNWIFDRSLLFTPGSQNYYCNTNYLLLGEIVTQVSGMPYEEYIEQKFLAPLGMTSTGFGDTWNGGSVVEKEGEDYKWFRYKGICCGCADMISNAVDLEKWGQEFIDNKVLPDNVISLMTQDHSGGYGYGVIPDESGFIYHEGNLPPYKAALGVNKERGLVLVMLDCGEHSNLLSVKRGIFGVVKDII